MRRMGSSGASLISRLFKAGERLFSVTTISPSQKKQNPFVQIEHADLKKLLRISPAAAVIWLQHKMHQGGNGASWCSLEVICDELTMDEKTVCRWRKWLVDHGWLVKTGERDSGKGRFKVPMYSTAIGEAPVRKTENRIGNLKGGTVPKTGVRQNGSPYPTLGKRTVPKSWKADRTQVLGPEVDSEKQVDSYKQEDSKDLSQAPLERKKQPVHVEEKSLSLQKKKARVVLKHSVDEKESPTLPAPDALVMTPPPDKDTRHAAFKLSIFQAFNLLRKYDPPWGPAEGKQLKVLLQQCPKMTLEEFHTCLRNWCYSFDHPRCERPCKFLFRITEYLESPLDQDRRPMYAWDEIALTPFEIEGEVVAAPALGSGVVKSKPNGATLKSCEVPF
jgi:hypothetical protein